MLRISKLVIKTTKFLCILNRIMTRIQQVSDSGGQTTSNHHGGGSNRVRDLSKLETQWIYSVDTLAPKGLNIDLDINCFISDY